MNTVPLRYQAVLLTALLCIASSVLNASTLPSVDTQLCQTVLQTDHKKISNNNAIPCATGRFSHLFEPSGLVFIQNQLVVIEDEPRRALNAVDLRASADEPSPVINERLLQSAPDFFRRQRLGPLDDLEGVARISDQQLMVIGSHDAPRIKSAGNRNRLVLFDYDGHRLSKATSRGDLIGRIIAAHADDKLGAKLFSASRTPDYSLNIEALAYDRARQQLMIGLRSPVLSRHSIIVVLDDVLQHFETDQTQAVSSRLVRLDLDRGGIRAMAYDDASDSLLLVSKREPGKYRYKLWRLPLSALAETSPSSVKPERIRAHDKKLFEQVEGLAVVGDGVFFVQDNGDIKKQRPAEWFFIERVQLGL